ncbi:17931_t:CDS:2 [Rhizophagus irregularis]|nr:17931_t:CDS:2 [Rhizophagus irregularis]
MVLKLLTSTKYYSSRTSLYRPIVPGSREWFTYMYNLERNLPPRSTRATRRAQRLIDERKPSTTRTQRRISPTWHVCKAILQAQKHKENFNR